MPTKRPLLVAAAALGIAPNLEAIAKACGLTRNTLGNVLSGRTRPADRTLRKLARGLRVTEDQARALLTPEPETSPPGIVETPVSNSPETLPSDLEASHEDHE